MIKNLFYNHYFTGPCLYTTLYKTIQDHTILVIEAPEHYISMSKSIICFTVTGPPPLQQ